MRVKCSLCDKIDQLDDDTQIAKRLRNRPIHTYLCNECHERIKIKTENRMKTGRFKLYPHRKEKERVKP
ncbi:YlaI family protein [Bacillus changyiensis]|uniref:YlaI family protein n=1 Tax=Bacillus changyiensis TaxID=3004103 RepID=UPI0022E3ED4E|nr:YlaI family protein [Bacillus changyiensis]MDA1475685.1 YlaI family protein [Bacillus changyiensis]